MKYLNCINSRQVALAVIGVSALTLATGCRTSHKHYAYYSSQPPAVVAAGGSENTTEGEYRATAGTVQAGEQTVIPLYQETVKAGTREVDAGTVRLRKVVKTETVNQPVQVRRETVVIDREPASGNVQQGAASQPFQEQDYVIHLKREEPVVETQVQEIGQIVARKQSQAQQQNVQRQIRRDEVDIVKQANPQDVIITQDAQQLINQGAAGGSERMPGEEQNRGQQRSDQP